MPQEPAQAEALHQLVNRIPEMTAHDHAKQARGTEAPPGQTQELDPVAAFLERAVSRGASSQEVAEVVARAFQGIGRMLEPIIGRRGMAALYRRSVHLAGPICAQISAASEVGSMAMDLAVLEAELAKQTAADAATAGTALLHVFYVLLTSLIGPSLTERLLRSIWADFLSGSSARDTKS